MSVFVLGGKAKSFEIYLPKSVSFRPTSVMLRRKLFDYKQDWNDVKFYDLCSGSGSVGFEALSRNVSNVTFVDKSENVLTLIKKNKDSWIIKFPEDKNKINIVKSNALEFFDKISFSSQTWCFFDPPYQDIKLYDGFVERLNGADYSTIGGIVIEYEIIRKNIPTWVEKIKDIKGLRVRKELESSDRKLLILQGENNGQIIK